jgi:hypothetical protein
VSLFAPGSVEIFVLTQYLNLFGIQVTDVYADQLLIKATGTVDAFTKAFSLEIHDFVRDGTRFHRPSQKPEIPFILRDILVTIIGPSDEARFRSRNVRLSDRIKSPLRQPAPLSPRRSRPVLPNNTQWVLWQITTTLILFTKRVSASGDKRSVSPPWPMVFTATNLELESGCRMSPN